MHALTVQYFEVVELYRVSADLHQVERCLFVPMKLLSFTDALVAHYQGVLADAALNQRARNLLTTEYGVVRVHPCFDATADRRFRSSHTDGIGLEQPDHGGVAEAQHRLCQLQRRRNRQPAQARPVPCR